jgi:tetratricopeptide (TPR) repeat protein
VKTIEFSTVLKWVGSLTAILSLFFGIRQLVKIVSDRVEANRKIDALLKSEDVELKVRDYAAAWRSLEQASQITSDSAKVHLAQENLAMAWLEDVHLREGEKWSDISAKVEPVLSRGVASTKDSQRSADLLAHIGWAYFLRSRDGVFGLDPAGAYSKAAAQDKNNPYAEAMWGHWILWNRGKLSDASQHFSSGLASGRQRDFVRTLQFAALGNCPNGGCDAEMIRVANDIRKENGTIDADTVHRIFSNYYGRVFSPNPGTNRFLNVIPPREHIATFHWLFDGLNLDESESRLRSGYLATIEEAAGQREEALANYRELRAKVPMHSGPLSDAVDGGIKRLSSAK